MFGSGIGELNVFVRSSTSGEDAKIWGLSGDAGNNWYMGQAPISSSSPFKVSIGRLGCNDARLINEERQSWARTVNGLQPTRNTVMGWDMDVARRQINIVQSGLNRGFI